MLEVKHINYEIKNRKLLQDISFEVKQGEFIVILGPNGAGKSTLLSYISNELNKKNEDVYFKNKPIKNWEIKEITKQKAKFSQQLASEITLEIKDVVMMGRYPYFETIPDIEDEKAVEKWMLETDTNTLKDREYQQLSGGEKQRVHLARVFCQLENNLENKLFLLDEPLNNLDVAHQFKTLEIIKKLTRKGNAALVVLHDINLAAQFADLILLLKNGKLVAIDTPKNVLKQEIISNVYNFPCQVSTNPITNQPLILFG